MQRALSKEFLVPTQTIESAHPDVVAFARRHVGEAVASNEQAIKLYYAVRDEIRYDPYRIALTVAGMKASATLSAEHGWCVSKAVLLAACLRSTGIAARLGFADVKNHLSTARLRQKMATDIFYWHGYTEIFLNEKWVKATPAFNIELCEKFRLLPLEFDGESDSIYHPYDADGNRHMEYVNHRGAYSDLPLDEIRTTFEREYGFAGAGSDLQRASFDDDVTGETANDEGL